MDYTPRAEVVSPLAESREPCQRQHARELPQRNGRVGPSGERLGGENSDFGRSGIQYTGSLMRRFVLAYLLTAVAFSQTNPQRIPAEEAAKHLRTGPQPAYPALAQQARIQGNVILEARIGESGSLADIRMIAGHPMLVPAAIEAVRHWKYEPFQVGGKPVSVVTDILITFGDNKQRSSAH